MDMQPIESSNIAQVGYDAETQTLAVQFRTGDKTYTYSGVPPEVHQAMLEAPSPGGYFAANVKGQFAYE